MNFFITGLPRTRLAWLANFLTYGNVFCGLDELSKGIDWIGIEFPSSLTWGNADHGIMMVQDQVIAKWPEAKWIIIERDYQEVLSSIKALGIEPDSNQLHDMYVKLGELKLKVNPLVIPYHELDQSLNRILHYIDPQLHIPSARWELLLNLNVQVHKEAGLKNQSTYAETKVEPARFSVANREYLNLLWEMCAPNQAAYTWMTQIIAAALTWDHIIDDDPLDKRLTDQVFKAMLIEWLCNPFVLQYGPSLAPTISSVISNWQYSYMDGASKDCAYSVYADLPSTVAFLIGGQQKVDEFMPRIRKLVAQLRKEDDIRDSNKK